MTEYTYKKVEDATIIIDFNKIKEFIISKNPEMKNHMYKLFYEFNSHSDEILKEVYGIYVDDYIDDNNNFYAQLCKDFDNFLNKTTKDYDFLHITKGKLQLNFDDVYADLKEKYPDTFKKQFLDNITDYVFEFAEEQLNYEYNASTLNKIALDWISYCNGKE